MKKVFSVLLSVAVSLSLSLPPSFAQAIDQLNLPAPGSMIGPSSKFVPAIVKGISIYPDDPFKFDFIIDSGNTRLNDRQFADESNKLIKYFLAALTVPEKEDWVNLSPYEKDRIIPQSLGITEMGRDMLAQDYILKQLTSSLIYPEKQMGKEFWSKVYAQTQKTFGTANIPVSTFNKVWIVPSQAVVWEHNGSAYVVKSHLKVMLEKDYLSLNKHLNNNIFSASQMDRETAAATNAVASDVVRQMVLPALEKEVNEGANFASLRQIFNSAILAAWYKQNLKETILGQVYANQNKVNGIDLADKNVKQQIYERYLQAFKKGAYNFIKEDVDPLTQKTIARKYFSGGESLAIRPDVEKVSFAQLSDEDQTDLAQVSGTLSKVTIAVVGAPNASKAMTSTQAIARAALHEQALQVVRPNKVVFAMDDTDPTAKAALTNAQIPFTDETYSQTILNFRRLAYSAPGIENSIGAVIINANNEGYTTEDGKDLLKTALLDRGISMVVKTDEGSEPNGKLKPWQEKIGAKLAMAKRVGAVATKFRSVTVIGEDGTIDENLIQDTANQQIEQTLVTQEAGLSTMYEPEVLRKGTHGIAAAFNASVKTLQAYYEQAASRGVWLEGTILKTSFVAPGDKSEEQPVDPNTVGRQTLKALIMTVPAQVPGAVFLSGGIASKDAIAYLDAVERAAQNDFEAIRNEAADELDRQGKTERAKEVRSWTRIPWQISSSFGRGLQGPALNAWKGNPENVAAAQEALLGAATLNQAARLGVLKATPSKIKEGEPVNFAINGGSGRIGLNILRVLYESKYNIKIVALNDLVFAKLKTKKDLESTLIRLIKQDFGKSKSKDVWDAKVTGDKDEEGWFIQINDGDKIRLLHEEKPANLPWKKMNVKVVYEATGVFTTVPKGVRDHLAAGAKQVIITAPSDDDVPTVVAGVNSERVDQNTDLCSGASCTTGSIAPPLKVISDEFGISWGDLVTIHSYTNDQATQPIVRVGGQQRGMAAAENIIPTTTGAAKAIGLVIPELKGIMDGDAVRVGHQIGSLSRVTIEIKRPVTVEEIKAALIKAANGPLKGIMQVVEGEWTSQEILGNPHSAIVQLDTIKVSDGGRKVKFDSWYDNEYGYSNRITVLGADISGASLKPDTNDYRNEIPPSFLENLNARRDKQVAEAVARAALNEKALQVVRPNKVVFAMDDTDPTAKAALTNAQIPFTDETYSQTILNFRRLAYSAPGIENSIGAVIINANNEGYTTEDGKDLLKTALLDRGISMVVKTDEGSEPNGKLKPWQEKIGAKLAMAKRVGAVATKFRSVTVIGEDGTIDENLIQDTANQQIEQTLVTQEAGLSTMYEPEVLRKGTHGIAAAFNASVKTLQAYYEQADSRGVWLEGTILKTSFVAPGDKSEEQPVDPNTVGRQTLKALIMTVPAQVPGAVFLSGGIASKDAIAYLDAVERAAQNDFEAIRNEAADELDRQGKTERAKEVRSWTRIPWQISSSFGRGLQGPALNAWKGEEGNIASAQEALLNASNLNQKARIGVLHADAALVAPTVNQDPWHQGGINLDSAMMGLQVVRDGEGRMLPVSQQPIGQFEQIKEWKPVMINIQRNINLPAQLGVSLNQIQKNRLAAFTQEANS